MALTDSGWLIPAQAVSVTTAGRAAWADAANVITATGYATSSTEVFASSAQLTEPLRVTDFSITVPAANVIVGIEVKLDGWSGNQSMSDAELFLVHNGSRISGNKLASHVLYSPDSAWVTHTHGGAADTFGITISNTTAEDATFGFEVATINDSTTPYFHWARTLRMKVYYDTPSAATSVPTTIGIIG